ncbi:integrase [Kitasatospora sp. NPDC098663]|uniref:integrase n=1 Tax=Kitasatospora sp. NPDC098663 TaxID=3364096 RepID=UPI0037FA9A45
MAAPSCAGGMSVADLLALPVAIDLDTANRALGIGRSTGYALAKAGEYPVKVLRLGNAYRVVTAELLSLLGLGRASGAFASSGEPVGGCAHELCA